MNVLIVVAHPDDEVLMCGGTIARHVTQGDKVRVLMLADGVTSRDGATRADIDARWEMASKASDLLGYSGDIVGLKDQRLDTYPQLDLVKRIESEVRSWQPEVVYTHWHGDLNRDHQIVSQLVKVACRPRIGGTIRGVLMGEVPSSTELDGDFKPSHFISIDLDQKMEALLCYQDEMPKEPHARSGQNVRALAQFRGARCGAAAAEAFVPYLWVQP